ncbi:MAG: EAL domain-containing response regulator, partial [Gammaproteobacteria bacterium]
MKDYNLLVVDDEPFVLNLSIRVLNNLGFEHIATASNGKDALAMVTSAQKPYDIIICDLNMPEMDGVAFMRLVSETDYSGSLILLSGEEERMLETALELAKAHSLNVLGFIQKPIKPDLLNDLIAQHNPNSGDSNRFTPQDPITEEELRDGLAPDGDNDVILVYQPKVHVGTGTITGVEALARWQHPERGLLGPGSFIPLAEKTGLITQLTRRIFEKATHQTAEWMLYGINLKTSVNVSINSFSEPNFSDFLIETTEQAGLDPKQIVLEVTETQVMKNAVECMEIMMRLRLKKFGLSIDDFGTGNSSMSQLKNIPFTE